MRILKAKKYYEELIRRTFDCQGTSDINHAPAVRPEFAYVTLLLMSRWPRPPRLPGWSRWGG